MEELLKEEYNTNKELKSKVDEIFTLTEEFDSNFVI